MKNTRTIFAVALIATAAFLSSGVNAKQNEFGRGNGPVIYVVSQGLFYDSIVLADLPALGNFQQLRPGEGPSGLATEFGPGDAGYVGGRWWVDVNGDSVMDEGDVYFLCPLLGPGRSDM